MNLFKTKITELLRIEYPIIQAPMNWATDANLVAAVSNAGGLGVLGPNAGNYNPSPDPNVIGERLREQIKLIKTYTKKPFAVNFPIGHGASKVFSDRSVEVAIEESIPVAITATGSPAIYTKKFTDAGILVMHAVSSVKHAMKAQESGVNAVIAEGYGGGGHTGYDQIPTLQLVPQIVDAVEIPVLAAGGISDARGFLSALILGADGVYMGTRFLACKESPVSDRVKAMIVSLSDEGVVSWKTNQGIATAIKNKFTDKVIDMLSSGKSDEEVEEYSVKKYDFGGITNNRRVGGLRYGDTEFGEIYCGKGAGLIKSVESASDIINGMIKGAKELLGKYCNIS